MRVFQACNLLMKGHIVHNHHKKLEFHSALILQHATLAMMSLGLTITLAASNSSIAASRAFSLTSTLVGLYALTVYSLGAMFRARTVPVTDRLRTAAVRECC